MDEGRVKIYSTSWCPSCIKAKKYFDMQGVKYKEINVADRHEDRNGVMEVSGQRSVPVICIDENVIVGFDKALIDKALEVR
ncbi:glutaredoxin domain-containing protein [Inconstantimicrobium mannanitabidum]|uniref:NrdH-redoxin n=1 Tax=Inconstantimicrobium mannanitabidum TaxID=1604901 RepID=A0ACB5RI54_9CLOT|nr:glutaredoxin domain-containing protein [Clostridium sp. TW13]GKX68764.1 NrdH-redoxin [Clostridium sp. TW13]